MFPRDPEALIPKDPSRSPQVALSLKEARGFLSLVWREGCRIESSLEMLRCTRIAKEEAKGGVISSLCQFWAFRING